MSTIGEMTTEDLEQFVEQKLLEFFGDPDVNLHLKDEFRKKLEERLTKSSKRTSHAEVVEQFGKD